MTTSLTRRRFLAAAGATAGAAVAGVALHSTLFPGEGRDQGDGATSTTDGAVSSAATSSGRVLVVVEMAGGNDGLNTLVPADGRYRDGRPTLAIPEADLVPLEGITSHALHPAVAPLAATWAADQLAVVQCVGLQQQSRSHFAATDRWRAGNEVPGPTSWLGRWLDETGDADASPLRAVALGTDTRILAAEHAQSTVVLVPDSFTVRTPEGTDPATIISSLNATADPRGDGLFGDVQAAIPSTIEALDLLDRATPDGAVVDGPEARHGRTTRLLETAARIVGLNTETQVIVVGVEGFDTHGQQAGLHASLLEDVANGITTFLAAMERQGRADDALVITTSEFGRRAAENGSAGTDHGFGNIAFLAGPPVRGGIVGDLGLDRLVDGDLPVDIDTRSLYAVALDWLGGPTDDLLGGQYDRFDLLRS